MGIGNVGTPQGLATQKRPEGCKGGESKCRCWLTERVQILLRVWHHRNIAVASNGAAGKGRSYRVGSPRALAVRGKPLPPAVYD